jgi:hypothetical protein
MGMRQRYNGNFAIGEQIRQLEQIGHCQGRDVILERDIGRKRLEQVLRVPCKNGNPMRRCCDGRIQIRFDALGISQHCFVCLPAWPERLSDLVQPLPEHRTTGSHGWLITRK